jgi:hypothetical protein
MPEYIRPWYPGGTQRFDRNLLERQGNDLLTPQINPLRDAEL